MDGKPEAERAEVSESNPVVIFELALRDPSMSLRLLRMTLVFERSYTSGLVFGKPMTFRPSFHWPRFFRSSTRSKRFRTLRLAAMVLAPFRLRCCDINS
jgi:hypothetical protein